MHKVTSNAHVQTRQIPIRNNHEEKPEKLSFVIITGVVAFEPNWQI